MQISARAYVAAALALASSAFAPAARADINGWYNGAAFTFTGHPDFSGDTLSITTQSPDANGNPTGYNEANSAFYNEKQGIVDWGVHFTYQLGPVSDKSTDGYSPADGFAFVLQNSPDGVEAVGDPGSYHAANIQNSVAVDFNIFSPRGVGMTVYNDGNFGGTFDPTGDVNLASGHLIDVSLLYKQDVLTAILQDTATNQAFTTSYAVNIGSYVHGSKAYVGFTGGTGGGTSDQFIRDFSFGDTSPVPELSTTLSFAVFCAGGIGLLLWRRRSAHL